MEARKGRDRYAGMHRVAAKVFLAAAVGSCVGGLFWVRAARAAESTGANNQACFECHAANGRRARSSLPSTDAEATVQDRGAYERSVHAKLACTECHIDAGPEPHDARLSPVDCAVCHEQAAARYALSDHAPRRPSGRAGATCTDCHGVHDTLPASNPESMSHPRKLVEVCAGCHVEVQPSEKRVAQSQAFESYTTSIHFRALEKGGLVSSATCVSCHSAHEVRQANDPLSTVNRLHVPETCGSCHRVPLQHYEEGVHGQALAKGSPDTPVCTDCHGEHGIRARRDPKSRVFATAISKATCPQCHSAVRINERYGLTENQTETYKESFHGLADQFGLTTVANCASCHGAHRILHSSDPKSSVNRANLPQTCGNCHPGAGENFAQGGVHRPMAAESQRGALLGYVRTFYLLLIALTISGMAFYNALDYLKTVRLYRQSAREQRVYLRFVRTERRQHMLLATSFIALVFSGFALRYPDAFWVKPFVNSALSFLVRSYAHRVAAIVFVVLCIYHAYYLFFTARGKEQLRAMLPRKSDAVELKQQLFYYLGARSEPARFGRFSYIEKVEYFALIWGSLVMVLTGAILWFEEEALGIMPKWGWDLAEVVHLYEAWLATLAIVVWHFYHVLFKPSLRGPSFAMFTGEVSEEEMRHEHPAELEALQRQTGMSQGETKPRSH